jgi:hypothetical protein
MRRHGPVDGTARKRLLLSSVPGAKPCRTSRRTRSGYASARISGRRRLLPNSLVNKTYPRLDCLRQAHEIATERTLKVRTVVRTKMPARRLNQLTAREVASAKDGSHADGGGLYLRVQDGRRRRSWVFRFTRNGKTTETGLGSAATVTLTKAREEAKRLREMVDAGKNPRRAQTRRSGGGRSKDLR